MTLDPFNWKILLKRAKLLPLLLAVACRAPGSLQVDPDALDWGEVDFYEEMPEGGYDPTTLTLTNTGERSLEVTLPGFDHEHLCLEGFTDDQEDVALPTLEPGSTYLLVVGVCGYRVEGSSSERDTLVEGEITFTHGGEGSPVAVPFSFTPVKNIPVDTG